MREVFDWALRCGSRMRACGRGGEGWFIGPLDLGYEFTYYQEERMAVA